MFPLSRGRTADGGPSRLSRRSQTGPDVPTAPVRSGDFRVIVRTRGELKANRNGCSMRPEKVLILQIVWLAPPNVDIHEGDRP